MNDTNPILSRKQVRLVDELATRELRIPSIVLMENAGRNAASVVADRYQSAAREVVVLCGAGNNGGDGFVIARHLHNAGRSVRIILVGDPARLTPDASTNHAIAEAMGLSITTLTSSSGIAETCETLNGDELLIDALLGTGFAGSVREPMATAIQAINDSDTHSVVAIDVPSGLDCDTGRVGNVAVRAELTVTFVAAKRGFANEDARQYLGETVVVDIGTPPELTERVQASEIAASE